MNHAGRACSVTIIPFTPGRSEKFSLQDAEKARQRRSRIAQRLNVPKRTASASSLAAALLDGLFEHPAGYSGGITTRGLQPRILQKPRCLASEITGNLPSAVAFSV
jgi:hypothetical protein